VRGRGQFGRGPARGDVGFGEEQAVVAAQHVGGAVALDALQARVPAGHAALRVEQEDRLARHRVEHLLQLPLARPQGDQLSLRRGLIASFGSHTCRHVRVRKSARDGV
jgi:hypothetical protein